MRAQVSIEYLLITGFSLALIAPLLVLFASQNAHVNDQFQQSQAQQAADALAQSAQRVYYAGPPSKETIRTRIPEGVRAITITENVIEFTLDTTPESDVVAMSNAPLIPTTLNQRPGPARISVQATATGVLIEDQ